MAWITQPGPPLEAGEDELQLKVEFAGYLSRGKSAREAAYTVFRHDKDAAGNRYFGRALQAVAWEADPFVQEEIDRFRSPDEVPGLHPSDDEVDLEILEAARSAADPKAKATLYELYLNARGRSTKAAPVTNLNVDNRTQNVMAVPPDMSVEEAKQYFVRKQSLRLVGDARAA